MRDGARLQQIVQSLHQDADLARAAAERQARAAFFDWVVALAPDADVPRAAWAALHVVDGIDDPAPALHLFRDCLRAATVAPPRPRGRRRAARRVRRDTPRHRP